MSYLYGGPPTRHIHGPSEFAVIALEADTEVTFHKPEGVDFFGRDTVLLNAYEAYQVMCCFFSISLIPVNCFYILCSCEHVNCIV